MNDIHLFIILEDRLYFLRLGFKRRKFWELSCNNLKINELWRKNHSNFRKFIFSKFYIRFKIYSRSKFINIRRFISHLLWIKRILRHSHYNIRSLFSDSKKTDKINESKKNVYDRFMNLILDFNIEGIENILITIHHLIDKFKNYYNEISFAWDKEYCNFKR